MAIRNLSQDVVLVTLPNEPQLGGELKTINETISSNPDCNVIIDFSAAEMITSSNLSNLLILHGTLQKAGRRLVFFNVAVPTKCIFRVAGLDVYFDFAADQAAALAALERTDQP